MELEFSKVIGVISSRTQIPFTNRIGRARYQFALGLRHALFGFLAAVLPLPSRAPRLFRLWPRPRPQGSASHPRGPASRSSSGSVSERLRDPRSRGRSNASAQPSSTPPPLWLPASGSAPTSRGAALRGGSEGPGLRRRLGRRLGSGSGEPDLDGGGESDLRLRGGEFGGHLQPRVSGVSGWAPGAAEDGDPEGPRETVERAGGVSSRMESEGNGGC